ncbi:MAG: alpha-E domain-containing protein [Pirellulaceae bacterium]|nr:alpha-E domain-containing protein [Pirellulaceae bacterium]
MLSRVANSMYWMARYIERAENLSRYIEVTLNVILDQPDAADRQWKPLILATGDALDFYQRYNRPDAQQVIHFLTFDPDYSNSIKSCLTQARENARTIRETISSEAWEQINEFYHWLNGSQQQTMSLDQLSDFYQRARLHSHLFNGILDATMSHGEGWHFFNLGRLIERADQTSRILDVKYFSLLPKLDDVGTTIDDLQWSAVLRSVSGFEVYRKRYRAITVPRVVEFLILEREFPRAILFSLDGANRSLHAITGSPLGIFRNVPEQRLGQLLANLAYADVRQIISRGLHEFADELQVKLNEVDEAIFDEFFALRSSAPLPVQYQLSHQ